ncbi:MAG: ribosome maturation factor RimP [Candidatus Zixiibacteriota bacterium]|nr:MAG: ribosome maturation factor RimP [candidate division Zixibacteria bacterium]
MIRKEKIAELISEPIEQEGFDLVELKLSHYKSSNRLQIFVDSDNGVKLDDCARLTRVIAPVLEAGNLFKHGYIIEVSSPGLDRPLVTAREFRRRIGETVRIFFNDNESAPASGELISADDRYIELQTKDGTSKYDLVNVKMGKIIF